MEVATTLKQSISGVLAMPSRMMTSKVCSAPGSFDPHALNNKSSNVYCYIDSDAKVHAPLDVIRRVDKLASQAARRRRKRVR